MIKSFFSKEINIKLKLKIVIKVISRNYIIGAIGKNNIIN